MVLWSDHHVQAAAVRRRDEHSPTAATGGTSRLGALRSLRALTGSEAWGVTQCFSTKNSVKGYPGHCAQALTQGTLVVLTFWSSWGNAV